MSCLSRSSTLLIVIGLLSACGDSTREPVVVRLVDHFDRAVVKGRPDAPAKLPPRTEWRFDDDAGDEVRGWEAGPGVSGLAVRNGRLTAKTISDFPIIHVERTSGLEDRDLLHAVEVRLRASKGTNLAMSFESSQELDLDGITEDVIPWPLRTPIIPGDELQTYRLSPATSAFAPSFPSSSIRHILLRPTDAEGAEVEIESVRLVFRREYLASIPAGVSWQGFRDIFRETIVTRSPERAIFTIDLPKRPWLDLALGTLEEYPVTFRVGVRRPGHYGEEVLLQSTVTTPHRWEAASVDLRPFAGQRVELTLNLEAREKGALGFWGAPAVRNRGARPEPGPEWEATRQTLSITRRNPPQGVIVIIADTLRRDHLDAYGYERETAPLVTRLASQGALFRDAISQGAWTKVSVPSILTSLYPTTLQIKDFTDRVPASATTLAEVYREAGYATLATSSVPFSGRASNLHQGVEVLHERTSVELPPGVNSSKTARVFVDRLLPWLEAHRDVPLFAFLHVMDPHDPYEPYRPYDTVWAKPGARAEFEKHVEKVKNHIESPFMRRRGLPTAKELQEAGVDAARFVSHELDWYDGSIRGTDMELERLLEKLRQLDLEDEILVVFTSDHGEEFLDHGRHFHELDLYGEMTNVPLILRMPGVIRAGTVIDQTVQSLDLMPTLLELSGLPIPARLQGKSLVPLLANSPSFGRSGGVSAAETWRRPAISEWARRKDQLEIAGVDAFSIVLDGWKLIHNVSRPPGYPEFELYDHVNDPLDKQDLASQHPEVVDLLAATLEDWHEAAVATRFASDSETVGVSDDELEKLRALGYIQ